ncbi:MAG: carboxypeptidase-like regulatory domain-containing protein, partial [Acidobacteriota bacterium]|nr:carboxypeptidase-like regulatory domain-containing protein [Acidobacteriota bacterium]
MAYTTRIARLLATLTVSVLMALSLTATIFAQSNKATLSGAVTDAQGAVVTDADVTIRNIATGATRQIKTNADGFFEAPLLDIGAYEVTVTRQGFQTVKRENITLQTGTETTVDVQLPAGEVTSQVTVTAEAPLVQTETSERGTIVTGREVTELPLSGR